MAESLKSKFHRLVLFIKYFISEEGTCDQMNPKSIYKYERDPLTQEPY